MKTHNIEIIETELVLTALRRVALQYVSPEILDSLRISIGDVPEIFAKQISMLIDLPSQPLTQISGTSRIVVPKTWFDNLRNEISPNFLTKKYPIKTRTIEIPYSVEVKAVYPKLPVGFNYGGDVRFTSVEKIPSYLNEIKTVGQED